LALKVELLRSIKIRSIPELDTLRFVAVTLVLGHHLFFESNIVFQWLSLHGYSGVGLFFTLSGFIITRSLIREYNKNQSISLKSFWIRRIFRLWPSWMVTLLLSSVIVYYFALSNPQIMDEFQQKWWHYFFHFGNYSYAFYGKLHTLFGHFWSLAVEEHFYLVWPLIFIYIFKHKKQRLPIYLLLLVIPYFFRVYYKSLGYENVVNTFSTHTRFDALIYGCLLAHYWNKLPPIKSLYYEIVLWGVSISIFQLGLNLKFYTGSLWISQSAHSIRSLAAMMIIYLLVKGPPNGIRKLWASPFFARLGILSYGVYLFHFITNTFLFKLNLTLQLDLDQISLALLSNILAYIPAYFAFQYIDKPFEKRRSQYLLRTNNTP